MKNNRGFTLVEVLISAALAILVALGVGAIIRESFKQTQNTITRGISTEFADSFTKWLHTSSGCVAALQGQALPLSEMNLTVNGFGALTGALAVLPGATNTNGGVSQIPTAPPALPITSGTQINPQLLVKSLTFKEKPGLSGTVRYNGVDLKQKVVQINLQMQTNTMNEPQVVRENVIELPVTVDAGNVVQFCNVELSQEQICMASGAHWDPTSGQCLQVESCTIEGRFARAKSNPASQCCEHYTNPWQNHITGTDSCPAGSVEQQIGEKYYGNSRTYSCGKKCTANIDDWEDFYVCLKCP